MVAEARDCAGGGAGGGGGPLLPAFYAGRTVLVTGATGFLGKVLVERLLATCPDVRELHLLLRGKRGQAPHARLQQLKQSQVFDGIRAGCPGQLDKLRVLPGDVTQPLLGLDATAIAQLAEVSVVFHNAATTNFSEPLRVALQLNVMPAIELMNICDQLPKLEALVHVSTAYSNAERRHVQERVYAAPASLAAVRGLVGALPTALLDELTPRYIHPKQNSYVFTKALAESVIDERRDRAYAAAIFRPSIVASSHRHPRPGWVQGLGGASGAVLGCSLGALKTYNLDVRARADLLPVDVAIDTMLAVAWEIATDKSREVRVYNCCSQENPLTWGAFCNIALQAVRQFPSENAVYYPIFISIKNRCLFQAAELALQTAPLHAAHYVARACGLNMQLNTITVSDRLRAMNHVQSYFSTRDWTFSTDNVQRLRKRLSDEDRNIYNLDIRDVNWEEHVTEFVRGVRRYLMKEKEDNLPRARRRAARLRYVHYMVLLILTISLYRSIFSIVMFIINL